MFLLGLTGSIGMGKSETARMFRAEGVPVYDADAAVHALYEAGGAAVEPIGKAFPAAIVDGRVDRTRLAAQTLGNDAAVKQLEAIVHPLVGKAQMDFLLAAERDHAPLVVLDVPLLFETGGEKRVDAVAVVSAPADVQRARVLARPGMSAEKFEAILKRQVPDTDKRARADFVIETQHGLEAAHAEVKKILAELKGRPGRVWAERRPRP
jgi:dephospho-CoA kinase